MDREMDGLAIDRQRADCMAIATARGWSLANEYVDQSLSATDKTKRRPAYDQLVEDFALGRFDAIICWDLDRLTRQPRQLEDWIDAAEERGLRLVTANGEADLTTDGGRLFARLKAAVARSEVERKTARQSAAQAQRAAQGRVPKGMRPLGYKVAGDIVPREAAAVRAMYVAFNNGTSLRAIAAALSGETGERVPTTVPALGKGSRSCSRPCPPTRGRGKLVRNLAHALTSHRFRQLAKFRLGPATRHCSSSDSSNLSVTLRMARSEY